MNNGRMLVVLLLAFLTNCTLDNEPPLVQKLKLIPENVSAGDRVKVYCLANDDENDALSFVWNASAGEILPFGYSDSAVWISPETPGACTISVTVSDGNAVTTYDCPVQVVSPGAQIKGYVYFSGTKIPVPDATVSIDNRETLTAGDGSFTLLSGSGVRSIKAGKSGYEDREVQLSLQEGLNSVVVELFSAINTCCVKGLVKNRSGEPIPETRVVLLNPGETISDINTTTDESGYYELRNVPRGKRTLCFISGNPYANHHAMVELSDSIHMLNVVSDQILSVLTGTLEYGGKSYRTVRIENRWWMAENLAWLPSVDPGNSGSVSDAQYYVYGYNGTQVNAAMASEVYHTYGVLYNWQAAKRACPEGWHLSTDEEWEELAEFVSKQRGPFNMLNDDWYEVARFLKSSTTWKSGENGTNDFGFSALPGGYRGENNQFNYGGFYGIWWTGTELSTEDAWSRGMFYNHDGLNRQSFGKASGLSVRCVRD